MLYCGFGWTVTCLNGGGGITCFCPTWILNGESFLLPVNCCGYSNSRWKSPGLNSPSQLKTIDATAQSNRCSSLASRSGRWANSSPCFTGVRTRNEGPGTRYRAARDSHIRHFHLAPRNSMATCMAKDLVSGMWWSNTRISTDFPVYGVSKSIAALCSSSVNIRALIRYSSLRQGTGRRRWRLPAALKDSRTRRLLVRVRGLRSGL